MDTDGSSLLRGTFCSLLLVRFNAVLVLLSSSPPCLAGQRSKSGRSQGVDGKQERHTYEGAPADVDADDTLIAEAKE